MERKDLWVPKLACTASASVHESLSVSLDNERTDLTAQPPLSSPVSLRFQHDNSSHMMPNVDLYSRTERVAPRLPEEQAGGGECSAFAKRHEKIKAPA